MTSTINKGKPAGSPASNGYGEFKVIPCSPAQARFIQRLLDERIHEFNIENASLINKKHASRIIEQLLACPKKPEAITYGSEKQVALIHKLVDQKVTANHTVDRYLRESNTDDVAKLDRDIVRKLIDHLFCLPDKPKPILVTVGAYKKDGIYYSIRKVRDREVLYSLQYDEANKTWIPNKNAIYDLVPEDRLTLSDASAFGIATGTCVHCARTLTLQKSVVAGMGKWCAQHYQNYK